MASTLNVVNTNTTDGRKQDFNVKVGNRMKLDIYQDGNCVWIVDTDRYYPIKNKQGAQSSINLRPNRYNAFKALAGLDGNVSDLSEKDLANAAKLKGKHGIKNVTVKNGGIAEIEFSDNTTMLFDIETNAEKNERLQKEKAEQAAKENKTAKPKEKSWTDKILNGIGEFIDTIWGNNI